MKSNSKSFNKTKSTFNNNTYYNPLNNNKNTNEYQLEDKSGASHTKYESNQFYNSNSNLNNNHNSSKINASFEKERNFNDTFNKEKNNSVNFKELPDIEVVEKNNISFFKQS